MEFFALAIIGLGLIVAIVFFLRDFTWWEFAILVTAPLLMFFVTREIMKSSNTSDTEFLGFYSVGIEYHEEWDEYIHKTCTSTSTDSKGNTKTYTYDCSYVKRHPEEWLIRYNDDSYGSITKEDFNILKNRWQTPTIFIDMNRDYYRKDGDVYAYKWNGIPQHAETKTTSKSYENRLIASENIFKFGKTNKDDFETYGLYDYPPIKDCYQSTILAKHEISVEETRKWAFLNGKFGREHQFRCYLFVYYNQPMDVVNKQLAHLKGPNKNEFFIFVSLDNEKKIQWGNSFSWMTAPELGVRVNSFLSDQKGQVLSIDSLYDFMFEAVPKYWERRDFSEFKYIDIHLTNNQLIWLYLIVFFTTLGCFIWAVMNEFGFDD